MQQQYMVNIGSDIKSTQIITKNVILLTPSSDQLIPAEAHPPLTFSPQTASVVTELQEQFLDSIGSNLIRPEITRSKIFSRIEDAIEKGQDILVHGPSGYGKSAVLHKLTQDLRENGIPCLPLRLDRRIPDKSARQYGMEMDLQNSPALALSAMAGDEKAVLILDQLDAIRWTAAHSSRAMDICKEMLRQVRALREQGKDRILVFACRTFDLENDPEIRAFLGGPEKEKFVKIAVEALAEEEIRGIIGPDFENLSRQHRHILAIPLHLSMWLRIREDGGQMPFQTATQLMRCFLENLRRTLEEKASVSVKEMNAFLKPLLDHMETRGEVSAPVGRLENSSTILLDKLISFGLLQRDRQRISFCHQRYLDYLIAERLLPHIYEGNGKVLTWLGSREQQSLFRREQLRQVLTLLTEESAPDFFSAAQNLLESPHVRFHMKHLVLEILGQLDAPSEEIRHYCLDLSEKDEWQGHMLETVFSGHAPWVRILLASGSIQRWLSLSQGEEAFKALSLLRSVTDTLPDQVAETLCPFLHKGEDWPRRILNTLCWDEANDSDAMFALRLDLIRCGHMKSPVCWDSLGSKSPLRAVRLVKTILSTWRLDAKGRLIRKENDDFKNWYRPYLQILKKTIAQCPEQGWNLLFPEIVRLTDIHPNPHYEARLSMWEKDRSYYGRPQTDFARGSLEILIQAGKILLDKQAEFLLEELSSLEKSTSPVAQEILMSLYADLPPHRADTGIRWLLSNSGRFWLDFYAKKSRWGAGIRLIRKLSPHCSQGLFHELEESLIHYHSPQEKFNAEYYPKFPINYTPTNVIQSAKIGCMALRLKFLFVVFG
ncbi:ATPase family protein associated with various cellular activities (AAA) [Desulfobotulus alkaliphilus]|uniref:ATPase family protein associated with various cellular activities (AAA) n=1 Tax=Desulfobotulus alkaliphilus TaxID=622671 RepID=A0A562RGL1_9BACT|nr:ATP-binding protein [Desulfobotulus alkaliphilus]TWI68128.1 ATPase family protein associated with various cellular activities (AAA) [Desulfobotulus alkaliphilus]